MTTEELLQAGITAAKSGDIQRATALLTQAIRADPNSEPGWLWLGVCLAVPEQRDYCFRRVLSINPNSTEARRLLQNLASPAFSSSASTSEAQALGGSHSNAPRPSAPPTDREPGQAATPISIQAKAPSLLSVSPVSTPSSQAPASPISQVDKMLIALIGLLLGLLICGGPLAYWVISGQFDQMTITALSAVWSPTPTVSTVTPTAIPTITPTPKPTVTSTSTPTPRPTATRSRVQRLQSVSVDLETARALKEQQNYAGAVMYLDNVIAAVPDHDEAYYLRATCYLELTNNQRIHTEYIGYVKRALGDLDQAIAIDPAKGDYYLARFRVYEMLAAEEQYRVDYDHLEEIALANLRKANALGNSDEISPRYVPYVLFKLGRCEEGLAETQQLIAAQKPGDPPSAGLNTMLADGYLCQGQLEKALEHIDLARKIKPSEDRDWMKLIILYNLGRLDAALAQLNASINEFPYYGGHRYFLRALIYADQGKLALAKADLESGWGQTWYHWGLFSYAQAKLALKQGDRSTGLKQLQYAEATMSWIYGPLVKRVQQELVQYNVKPLARTPSVTITVTPIPMPTRK